MRWYFAFFLVSGFCSLVYEVVWLRLAMANFGVTTPLVSLVLSVFMGGLALGSVGAGWLTRRLEVSKTPSPLALYALAELIIGASGIVVHPGLAWGRELLSGNAITWDSWRYYLGSGIWTALIILPSCLCMGATFPLAIAGMRREIGAGAETTFSFLYLPNVLGATAGTLLSAFALVELLGFRGTLLATTTLNGLLALCAFSRSRIRRSVDVVAAQPLGEARFEQVGRKSTFLWCLFLTGLISVAMEVVWIRQFTPYLGTVVYTFAAVLALYLAATFIGSQTYRVWIKRHPTGQEPRHVIFAWTILGLLGLLPLLTADVRLSLAAPLRLVLGIAPYCGAVGFLTPMLVDWWSSGAADRAGTAYAINVIGSILGPLVAGFWLLPVLGERSALVVLTFPLFIIAVLAVLQPSLLLLAARTTRSGWVILFAGTVAVSLVLAFLTKGYEEVLLADGVIRRDYTATVIASGKGREKRLLVNGVGITTLNPAAKMMAHLPLALLDQTPRDALAVCFGMGTTFRSLHSWAIRSTAVELSPSVVTLFEYFHGDAPQVLRSPRAHIVIDDGRRFLERSIDQYDVITIDPPPPLEAAASSLLYSREFYSIVKRRLRAGGIVQQWTLRAEPASLAAVARALKDSFPHVRVFGSADNTGFHYIASMKAIPPISAAVLASRLPPAAVADLVEWGSAATAEQQFETTLKRELSPDVLMANFPEVPALQDDRPFTEYFFVRRSRSQGRFAQIFWEPVKSLMIR